ncbi:TIGR02302 family protein [Aestuariivirga sp.]|uniref:TIGR02302 family protein n=1 Tax=Aestuariivirga sp. TaxID=2650926 RepID=UPI0025B878A0|nr:TIGR02302 family protein [Aestuariivirga sp.]MCA3554435.1 TIGR02302 family protein [Aestuariivirga sp.]
MANPRATHIDHKIAQARLALGFERVWAALHWPLVLLAAAAALVIAGLLPMLPAWARATLMVAWALAFLWSLRPSFGLRWPSRQEAMRRVEQTSGLFHRPVSARDDRLPSDIDDPLQKALWEEHRLRQLRGLVDLKAGVPRSRWRDIDPRALRLPVALALAVAVLLGPGDIRGSLSGSFSFAPPGAQPELALDAWLKPPAYTGKPPLLLTGAAMAERLKQDPELLVPENTVLSLRVAGAAAPKLTFHELVDGDAATPEIADLKPQVKSADGLFQAGVTLTRPATVRVSDGGRELGVWRIALIPDAAPRVEIAAVPAGDSSGTLTAKWKVSDDYGVTGVTADIYLADDQDGGVGFSGPGIFEFDPPQLKIGLRKASPKEETGESKADVAEHPWAGFMVEMTLTARDAAGHATESAKHSFRLPERLFTKPLARALIEQRRRLILNPQEAGGVAEMLDAILTYPKGLIDRSGTQIAIAAVRSRLRAAEDRADIGAVIGDLWQIAVNIEDGASADARAELEALRKELDKALRQGAPPERIAELTKKLRQALDRYMDSKMKEAQKRLAEGQQQKEASQPPGQTVTPQDLQKMLDMIDKLSKSGNNEAAQQLLSQLEDILRNLRPGMPQQGQGQGQGQESPLGQMLDKLTGLMRQQQNLMDETQRMPQQGMGGEDQPNDGQQPGEGKQSGTGSLGDRQQELGRMLEDMMKQFGRNGMEAPRAFGQAGKNMNRAEDSLRQGDREQALGEQGEAMQKLREGARGMAEQLMQQSRGQQDSQGQNGEARGDDVDPLGRPLPGSVENQGPDKNMLPSELAMERARQILEMLRSRAGESNLPKIERDYIDRLLNGLY